AIWRIEEDDVDFSVVPDNTALWRMSPDPRVTCTVYTSGDKVVGYTRTSSADRANVRFVMAADGQTAVMMAAMMGSGGDVSVPAHSNTVTRRRLAWRHGVAGHESWAAWMAQSCRTYRLDEYLRLINR